MKLDAVRRYALSLDAVTEEPHHHFSSFRVRGKIFVTMPPGEQFIHVFLAEDDREPALAMYPTFIEKLLWGGKVVGLRGGARPGHAGRGQGAGGPGLRDASAEGRRSCRGRSGTQGSGKLNP